MGSLDNTDICLNVVQATVLANEINLAKNLATQSVTLTNNNTNIIIQLQTELNDNKFIVSDLSSRLEYLQTILRQNNLID